MAEETMDTFSNPAPTQDAPIKDSTGEAHSIDTFDSPSVDEPVKEEVKEEKKDDDSQTKQLEKNEGKEEDEVKDDVETVEDKKDDDKPDEKAESKEEKEDEPKSKVKAKGIKAMVGEDTLSIPEDTVIVQKINGKNQSVTLKELRDNFAGKVVWEKKFSELDNKDKESQVKIERYQEEKEIIGSKFKEIAALADESENPMDAFNNFLDFMGRDTLQYNRKVMEHFSTEFEKISQMDEVERKLHWREKELDHLRKKQESSETKSKAEVHQRELLTKINQLRDAHGVSEEQFVEAHKSLSEMFGKITPEQAVMYALKKPSIDKALEITAQFEEDLESNEMDKLVSKTADTLFKLPHLTEQEAIKISANSLGYDLEDEDDEDPDLKLLREKIGSKRVAAKEKEVVDEDYDETQDFFPEY